MSKTCKVIEEDDDYISDDDYIKYDCPEFKYNIDEKMKELGCQLHEDDNTFKYIDEAMTYISYLQRENRNLKKTITECERLERLEKKVSRLIADKKNLILSEEDQLKIKDLAEEIEYHGVHTVYIDKDDTHYDIVRLSHYIYEIVETYDSIKENSKKILKIFGFAGFVGLLYLGKNFFNI